MSQVVHDYGDVCQAITELAVELDTPISTNDFRTSNGYVSERIDNGLGTFLSKAKHLSTLEVRGDEV